STSFDALALGTIAGGTAGTTTNFSYTLAAGNDTATIIARPNDIILKGYSGGSIYYSNPASQSVIGTILCEVSLPGTTAPAPTTFTTNSVTCTGSQINLSI
ncbi:type IV pilin-like G/H family protein, partial [Chamaesiphon sp. VAR_48_metabat_135_sub]|uniref:type IV pilin-like G/H family protein n=1 Tax=Chamaesiphon sp. VAR_48_metabat_135_sub TaxID=2964699 RepID=UPI00286A61AB